jgi:hypothetical protein
VLVADAQVLDMLQLWSAICYGWYVLQSKVADRDGRRIRSALCVTLGAL